MKSSHEQWKFQLPQSTEKNQDFDPPLLPFYASFKIYLVTENNKLLVQYGDMEYSDI